MKESADQRSSADKTATSTKRPKVVRKSSAELRTVESADLRLQLANALQSTLDLHITLNYFYDYASKLVECDGLRYDNAEKNISISLGKSSQHSAQYKVSSADEQLGELSFMRNSKFAETELAFVEMLIGVLFYPLRNALKYREALESSLIDSLTGMNNRLALNMYAEREIKLAKRHQKSMAMMVVDLDHFKKVNDEYGHLAGDEVLKQSAAAIRSAVRETDQVFRYGGEEFVILLNEADLDNAMNSAERVRKSIASASASIEGKTLAITASIGVSSLNEKDDFTSMFERADKALYQAKNSGRDQAACCKSDRTDQIKKIA